MANKGTSDDPIVELTVRVRRSMRDALRTEYKRSGHTMSQQVRMSLALWLKRIHRDPHGADGVMASLSGPGPAYGKPGAYQSGSPSDYDAAGAPIDWLTMPEPDPAKEPVLWSKWSARQGNAAIKELAGKHWPITHKDD